MSSLLTESYGNLVDTEGALKDHSRIKEFIQSLSTDNIQFLNQLLSTESNMNFSELETDFLVKIENSVNNKKILENNGYEETSQNNYSFEDLNYAKEIKKINYFTSKSNFIETINLNSKNRINKEYQILFQDNYILFAPISHSATEFYYKIEDDYELIDFKLNDNNFVFLLLKKQNSYFLGITHLGLEFSTYNYDFSNIDLSAFFNFIKLPNNITYKEIRNFNQNVLEISDIEYDSYEVTFGKKYYFINENYIWFNETKDFPFQGSYLDKIQIEELNLYNYLNILGLNDFLIDGKHKLSTKNINIFKELYKNKYDNTLNGGLNFFSSLSSFKLEDKDYIQNVNDYHININNEYFNIFGNFKYGNYEHGEYSILIKDSKIYLLDKEKKILANMIIYNMFDSFYFCNLKFVYKKTEVPYKFKFEFPVSSLSPYVFAQNYNERDITSIANNKKVIAKAFNGTETNKIDFQPFFDGYKIVFNNFFNYKESKYVFDNTTIKLKANDVLNIYTYTDLTSYKQHDIKQGKLFARDNDILYATRTKGFYFVLVSPNGYITDFWKEHQDKTVCFKYVKDRIVIVDEGKKNYDYKCYIPKISNHIIADFSKTYSSVKILDSDDLNVYVDYNANLLVTDKLLSNNPLFYKIFIDGENIELFDHTNTQILDYVAEPYKNGHIVYFNKEFGKTYYYNTKENKYNYFTPVKSYENIDFEYNFDKTKKIIFPKTNSIKQLSLNTKVKEFSDSTIRLFFYNYSKKTVNTISVNSNSFNKAFDLDLDVDEIVIQFTDDNYNINNVFLVEPTEQSFITMDQLVYVKRFRNDALYISSEIEFIDKEKLNCDKVNTKYNIINNKAVENKLGNIFFRAPFQGEIAITSYNYSPDSFKTKMFYTSSVGSNVDFYKNNFKSLNTLHLHTQIGPKEIGELSYHDAYITSHKGEIN